jgi:nucleoside-diphosphate-sugar epimerase
MQSKRPGCLEASDMTVRTDAHVRPLTISSPESSGVLVVGAGWLGSAIATAWQGGGTPVSTFSRSVPAHATRHVAADGIRSLRGDIAEASSERGLESLVAATPGGIEHVVLCVAPSKERGDSYGSLYPAAARGAVRLADALGARSLLYTSSTGVYGVTDGAVVREDTLIVPRDARQRALLDAEEAILGDAAATSFRRIVVRVAGLYGPGRDPARRFLADDDAGAAGRWTNLAWRDDVVGAVLHLQTQRNGTASLGLFNCADGHPVLAADIRRALRGPADAPPTPDSATEAGALPPRDAARLSPASDAIATVRSNQRVSVERLLATGWTPAVPTVYDGLVKLGHVVHRA